MEAVVTNNAPDTSKIVVTIPKDLPLGDDERALLAKGEKFFRGLRLKAHFTEAAAQTQESAVSVDNSQHDRKGTLTVHPPPHLMIS